MANDIHGTLEVEKNNQTVFAKDLSRLGLGYSERNLGLFYYLFGIGAPYIKELKPIAEKRGIRQGVSTIFQDQLREWDNESHGSSWISLKELRSIPFHKQIDNKFIIKQDCNNGRNNIFYYEQDFKQDFPEIYEKLRRDKSSLFKDKWLGSDVVCYFGSIAYGDLFDDYWIKLLGLMQFMEEFYDTLEHDVTLNVFFD